MCTHTHAEMFIYTGTIHMKNRKRKERKKMESLGPKGGRTSETEPPHLAGFLSGSVSIPGGSQQRLSSPDLSPGLKWWRVETQGVGKMKVGKSPLV